MNMWLETLETLVGIIQAIILLLATKTIFQNCDLVNSILKKIKPRSSFEILVITNEHECDEACDKLKCDCNDTFNALGFDCEWTNFGFQRPVALLQLASPKGLCCLFRLNLLREVPFKLRQILFDSSLLKLGVNTSNDSNLLMKDYQVQVLSTLDLRHLYPQGGGLASLAKSVAGMELDKTCQCSNWESPELSCSQKDYAAKDALAGVEIFKRWLLRNSEEKFTSDQRMLQLCTEAYHTQISFILKFLNIPFKTKHLYSQKNYVLESACPNSEKKFKNVYVTRKSPLYHNCFMHAPDGELLCSCDRRKAEWYVERGLAEVLPGGPYSIRLLFEPAARAGDSNGGRYYQQLKQNCCVVCGALQSYLKHNVVPKEYRKNFPSEMKDHQSHDIVLMCLRCHHLAAQYNDSLRQQLAIKCNAPITGSKIIQNGTIQKVKNYAKALITSGDVIPAERRRTLENEVKRFFKVDNLSLNLLQKAANLETKTINENFESHGIKVVKYFLQTTGLMDLEILWRKYFLETMNPQFLPALWSVTHNHHRLAAKLAEKQV